MSVTLIDKIVSGGQSGVDRAALDVAILAGIPCGGWCPAGRRSEEGAIPDNYPLQETPSSDYSQRTEWNVRDSDGTLILAWGIASGGTQLTIELAKRQGRPCRVVDLSDFGEKEVEGTRAWIQEKRIRALNVAGPRASADPAIYREAIRFLRDLVER